VIGPLPTPVTVGAVKVIVAEPLPATALTPVGASGLPAGVTEDDVAALDIPVELLAVTLKVYAVPLSSGETEQVVAGETIVQLPPAGEDVTV
jgi:hypothetical protein